MIFGKRLNGKSQIKKDNYESDLFELTFYDKSLELICCVS